MHGKYNKETRHLAKAYQRNSFVMCTKDCFRMLIFLAGNGWCCTPCIHLRDKKNCSRLTFGGQVGGVDHFPDFSLLLFVLSLTPLVDIVEIYFLKVLIGGGRNHRLGLFDMVLIKDNHISIAGGISNALRSVDRYLEQENLQMEVEVNFSDFKIYR